MKNTKHYQYYQRTKEQHADLFERFKEVHDLYVFNPQKWEAQFNVTGKPVLDLLRATERQLCSGMERGGYGAYSSKLAEKFWQTVKEDFPHIDFVGVKRTFVTPS